MQIILRHKRNLVVNKLLIYFYIFKVVLDILVLGLIIKEYFDRLSIKTKFTENRQILKFVLMLLFNLRDLDNFRSI